MQKVFLASLATSAVFSGILTACSTTQNASTPQLSTSNADHVEHGNAMSNSGMAHRTEMDLGPADADYDLRFIDAMILHHQGAVVMAKEVQQKSTRPAMKQLADEIIKAQAKEIAQMQQWRKAWYPSAGEQPVAWHTQMNHMMVMSPEQIKAMQMDTDLGEANDEFDLRFLNAMIPHHDGALIMAQNVLSQSKRPEIKQQAENILTTQQEEIDQMKQWRQAWYSQ